MPARSTTAAAYQGSAVAAARRLRRNRTAGGITRDWGRVLAACAGAGHCHHSVIKSSWQGPNGGAKAAGLLGGRKPPPLPPRRLLHETIIEGFGEIDLGIPELGIEGHQHVGGRLDAGGGNNPGERIDRL